MSLEELKARLDELRRKRAGVSASLQSRVYKQTRCPRSHIYVPDRQLDLPDMQDLKLFLKLDKTDQLPYKPPFDCEDFAQALAYKAKCYGFERGENWAFANGESNKNGGHRFNLVTVKPNAIAYFIEPQDDSFFTKTGKFKFILF